MARVMRGSSRVNKLILSVLVIGALGCSRPGEQPPQPGAQSTLALPTGLSRVADASQVCMVNDQFMGRAQIPVVVGGRTYYGCCPACKEKLEKQPTARTAQDPVTGELVDKAKAVIVQDGSGKVLYFASEDTLRRYHG
jgi:YHS domain-containing protein